MKDNFDLKKFLVENQLTEVSKRSEPAYDADSIIPFDRVKVGTYVKRNSDPEGEAYKVLAKGSGLEDWFKYCQKVGSKDFEHGNATPNYWKSKGIEAVQNWVVVLDPGKGDSPTEDLPFQYKYGDDNAVLAYYPDNEDDFDDSDDNSDVDTGELDEEDCCHVHMRADGEGEDNAVNEEIEDDSEDGEYTYKDDTGAVSEDWSGDNAMQPDELIEDIVESLGSAVDWDKLYDALNVNEWDLPEEENGWIVTTRDGSVYKIHQYDDYRVATINNKPYDDYPVSILQKIDAVSTNPYNVKPDLQVYKDLLAGKGFRSNNLEEDEDCCQVHMRADGEDELD